ncbi:MAG: hypothetical protein SGARI_008172 [Bacillariaceae sp.]
MNIPITVSKELAQASLGQTMYLSLVSYFVQECIAEMWGWIGDKSETTKSIQSMAQGVDPAKARKDAEAQKELMTRQARRKARDEREKNGLIIKQATYNVKHGEELDVTTQLQFWVSHSTLTLPARSKSELLGFYDLTAAASKSAVPLTTAPSKKWTWSDTWRDLVGETAALGLGKKASKEAPATAPTLTVEYDFQGRSYSITVKDGSSLRLPSQ